MYSAKHEGRDDSQAELEEEPWYRRTLRWGQTNLTEIDPLRYDQDLWSRQWRETAVQGVIVNAGGIIAYYPSEVPMHHRSPFLGDRDLFGEINSAARSAGLTVLARMDCNRAGEDVYRAHPDWFCIDDEGAPHMAAGRHMTCINSPYYAEYIPEVLREVVRRYGPDGFADNSWSGLPRTRICHCAHCRHAFTEYCGEQLPLAVDFDNPVVREWIRWNYQRRIEIWDFFNSVTQSEGGPDCLWIGMNSAIAEHQSVMFRDTAALVKRTPLVLMDQQFRREQVGFQENSYAGKLINGVGDYAGLAAESMAMYNYSTPPFRTASGPAAEARMWMAAGLAGSVQPWWHHIGAHHKDRRQYKTAAPLTQWHREVQQQMVQRRPVARVAVVWSQQNVDFYGKAAPTVRTQLPQFGVINALIRKGISYVPLHIDQVGPDLQGIDVLVLPAIGAMSQQQCEAIRAFHREGGAIIATGETSLYDLEGEVRSNFGLADVLGVSAVHEYRGAMEPPSGSWETSPQHSYLEGIAEGSASAYAEIFSGLGDTDQVPFGGRVERVTVHRGEPFLHFVPPFPSYPPETSWQRESAEVVPGLVLRDDPGEGRVAYFAADLDRCYARGVQPDHAELLAAAIVWACRNSVPVQIDGVGTVDAHLYRQSDGTGILHLLNLSAAGAWKMPMEENIPIGPLSVSVDWSAPVVHHGQAGVDASPSAFTATQWTTAELTVAREHATVRQVGSRVELTIPTLVDHEVVLLR